MKPLALICIVAAAVCEVLDGLGIDLAIGSRKLRLMTLGFGLLIIGVWLLPLL
jgi:hypothetical protein